MLQKLKRFLIVFFFFDLISFILVSYISNVICLFFSADMVPPSKPNITKLSDTSVMVKWEVPQNDGLSITFFKVCRDISFKEFFTLWTYMTLLCMKSEETFLQDFLKNLKEMFTLTQM